MPPERPARPPRHGADRWDEVDGPHLAPSRGTGRPRRPAGSSGHVRQPRRGKRHLAADQRQSKLAPEREIETGNIERRSGQTRRARRARCRASSDGSRESCAPRPRSCGCRRRVRGVRPGRGPRRERQRCRRSRAPRATPPPPIRAARAGTGDQRRASGRGTPAVAATSATICSTPVVITRVNWHVEPFAIARFVSPPIER